MKELENQVDDSASIVHINEHELDKECVRLPSQYRQAAYQAAELNRDADELKAEIKVKEAEFSLKVRSDPSKFSLDKVTEGVLNDLCAVHPEINKLQARLRKVEHQAALMKTLCSALDMKKRSLTNLVELHSAGYHAEVRPSDAGREALRKLSRSRIAPPQPREVLMKKRKERDAED